MKNLLVALFLLFSISGYTQCNVQASICTPGTAGPFNFVPTGGAYAGGSYAPGSCATGIGGIGNNFGFIILNITSSGPLNLLVNGNNTGGFLDVIAFNIPPGTDPCVAIQNPLNEIACNFASNASGCVQIGNAFPCVSTVPAPNVITGQQIMIIVHDWSNVHNTFTLQLGPLPGAQTGPPNATINPVGPFCSTQPSVQLQAVSAGGTWSGPGVSSSGLFNPATAGVGTHTITYSVGVAPCNSSSTTTITVFDTPTLTVSNSNVSCFGACDGSIDAGSYPGATYSWTPGGQTTQTISGLCSGTYTVSVNQNGCINTTTVNITQPGQVVIPLIGHN
jgi:hypothetical protein